MKKARTRATREDASFLDDAPKKAPRPTPPPPKRAKWRRVAYWGAVAFVWAVILGGLGLAYIAWDLPDVDEAIAATRQPTVRLVTQDGREIARRGDRYGLAVHLADLPPALPHAILATEDRRFYDHFGVDVWGIARAMWANLRAGAIVQGGSTLTQQAAKNLFLTPKRSLKRKAQEVLLALWLEAKFTKDEIFTIYLNRVYFGQGVYGVDAAARHYFGVPAARVNPYQAALLAGMLKGPNRYNPRTYPARAHARAEVVLNNMVAAGYMSAADVRAALAAKSDAVPDPDQTRPLAHHFTDWVLGQVDDFVTRDRDLTVIVTIDVRLQRAAERAVATMMQDGGPAQKRGAGEAAVVALAPDGRVLAMVGGKDYWASRFNRAVQAMRQPGSAFKPFVYLAGFAAGLGPDARLADEPLTIEGWSPSNFKDEYLGLITLNEAMTRSINTVAVKVSERAGRDTVRDMAKRLGVTVELTGEPSLALGVSEVSLLELTAAYGAFATGGIGVWPYAIAEIHDAQGNVLYARTGGGPGRVLPAGYAGAMNRMLSNVIESDFGTGKAARLGRPAAGKTGTSQDHRDAWFVGYTPDLIAGVWMGNDDGAPMRGVTGGTLPARLWKDFMTRADANSQAQELPAMRLALNVDDPEARTPSKEPNAVERFIQGVFQSIFGD